MDKLRELHIYHEDGSPITGILDLLYEDYTDLSNLIFKPQSIKDGVGSTSPRLASGEEPEVDLFVRYDPRDKIASQLVEQFIRDIDKRSKITIVRPRFVSKQPK